MSLGGACVRRRDFIFALSGIPACGWPNMLRAQRGEGPALSKTTLARVTFRLDGTSFAIFLPEAARASNSASGNEVRFDLTKGKRLERLLILAMTSPAIEAGDHPKVMLANGARLEYQVKDDTGGGSGGPVAELIGRMNIGPLVLSVRCTDQEKWGRAPAWCLPYLGRLEILERSP